MQMRGRRMYAILSIGILLIGTALFLRYANVEREQISYDRAVNRMLATAVYEYYSRIFEQKLALIEFAIKGIEKRGAEPGTLEALKKVRNDILKAQVLLSEDYYKFMEENAPLRSFLPPFREIYPEREEGAHLEMDKIQ